VILFNTTTFSDSVKFSVLKIFQGCKAEISFHRKAAAPFFYETVFWLVKKSLLSEREVFDPARDGA
jgi:hypothetical protein